MMKTTYKISAEFWVQAETEEQAKKIVDYEIQENIHFRGVPYAQDDSGILEYGVKE